MTLSLEDLEIIDDKIDVLAESSSESFDEIRAQLTELMKRVARLERTPSDPLS